MTADTFETITSLSNPTVKLLRSLDRKKGRSDSGLFLAEGARLVSQGLSRDWTAEILVLSNEMTERAYVTELAGEAEDRGCRILLTPKRLLSKISKKDNPQSVIAAFRQKHENLEDLKLPKMGTWLALYEIRDPGNLGTILRTADCANVSGVILIGNCCDPYSVEAVRASMGSVFDVPFVFASFENFRDWKNGSSMTLVAASVNGTQRHDEAIYSDRTVLLMGNEQAGLPCDVEEACDTLALIPMRGGADSLNLAQATAIMTYEVWRQRGFH